MKKQKTKHEEPLTTCSEADEKAILLTIVLGIVFFVVIIVENFT